MIKRENVLIFDDRGIPDIMVKFTRETNAQLFEGGTDKPHPMFVIGGEVYGEILISKYENTIINGRPYSLPYQKAAVNITNDEAARLCFGKGDGWHMMTAPEWGYLALDSLRNGTLPHGNTNQGSYHADKNEKGALYNNYYTLTGSGPITWAHDHTTEGVHDLCGNLWEMIRGLRIIGGQLQTAENNDAAMDIDLGTDSANWNPITLEGKPINISVKGGILTFTTDDPAQNWDGDSWGNVKSDITIPESLKELAIFAGEKDAWLYADSNNSEFFPHRGGYWLGGANAGVFALDLSSARSLSSTSIGFRSAYYRKTAN